MRQIVVDTETTGLSHEDGHRIIEIGCLELLDRKLTGNRFHTYLNPQREIDRGAVDVHGLDNQFLNDKPLFDQIALDFLAFVDDAELIIHNAPFDVGFINSELKRLSSLLPPRKRVLSEYCTVLDTLGLAKKKHPGQRNSLDALCKRYNVNNSHRNLHGALLDAEILAEVYLAMTGGQSDLLLDPESSEEDAAPPTPGDDRLITPLTQRAKLAVIYCDKTEIAAHEFRLADIVKSSGGYCIWAQ
jgi:DNA polymerase-3 subunit epsilon